MDCIRNNKLITGIVCLAVISLLLSTRGSSWSARTLAKKTADTYTPAEKLPADQKYDKGDHKVIVFYFHGNVRCVTCIRIEKLTKQTVQEVFEDEITKGVVEVRTINVEDPQNSHYINDYQLYTRSIVVSDLLQGKQERWKNLKRVWELVHNDEAFKRYIARELQEYLSGKP